jgi:hypothetical protein
MLRERVRRARKERRARERVLREAERVRLCRGASAGAWVGRGGGTFGGVEQHGPRAGLRGAPHALGRERAPECAERAPQLGQVRARCGSRECAVERADHVAEHRFDAGARRAVRVQLDEVLGAHGVQRQERVAVELPGLSARIGASQQASGP